MTKSSVDRRLLLLDDADNVLVATARLAAGEAVEIDGATIIVDRRIGLGHKIARRALAVGDVVRKYGAPIGSMTAAVDAGAHVHVHNLKSDYIPTYTHANQADFTEADR